MKNIGRWILAVTGISLAQLLSAQQLPEIRMVDIPCLLYTSDAADE